MSELRYTEPPWRETVTDTAEGLVLDIASVSIDADDQGRAKDFGRNLLENGLLALDDDAKNRGNARLMGHAATMYNALLAVRREAQQEMGVLGSGALVEVTPALQAVEYALREVEGHYESDLFRYEEKGDKTKL